MTEISYITQNGQQINLKDAAGREMLAAKQNKLKAGKGISISVDGTISAAGASESGKKKIYGFKDDHNDYNYSKLINYEDFEKGKHYKVTVHLPLIKRNNVKELYVGASLGQGGTYWDPSYVSEKVENGMNIEDAFNEWLATSAYHSGVSGWSPNGVSFIDKNKQYYDYNGDPNEHNYLYGDGYIEVAYLKILDTEMSESNFKPITSIELCPDFVYFYNKIGQNITTMPPYEENSYYYESIANYNEALAEQSNINLDDHSTSFYIADQPELRLDIFAKDANGEIYRNYDDIFAGEYSNYANYCIAIEIEEI